MFWKNYWWRTARKHLETFRNYGLPGSLGPVYQAGTPSGNPGDGSRYCLFGTAHRTDAYNVWKRWGHCEEGMKSIAKANQIPIRLNRVGSMFAFILPRLPSLI